MPKGISTARIRRALLAGLVGGVALGSGILSPAPASAESGFRVYVVEPGDSLSAIADENGVTLGALVEFNHIEDPDRVAPGWRLVIPGGGAAMVSAVSAAAPALNTSYQVTHGDTLEGIAGTFGTTVSALLAANGLDDPDLLRVGATLAVPRPPATPRSVPQHTVRSGETISAIADEYGVSVAELVRVNGLANANHIRVGMTLTLPAKALPHPPASVVAAVNRAAQENGIDPYLLLGLSYLESGWQMDAVSSTGARGFMQLMPETADWAIRALLPGPANWRQSLSDNSRLGAAYLDHLLLLSGGDEELALASYYQGWTSVHRDGLLDETRQYVDDVLALVERFRGLPGPW